jgi:hypothetical protein
MTTSSAIAPRRFPGRLFLFLGIALAVLGLLGYAMQLKMARLTTPWFLPISTTLGAIFLLVALWQARSVWRVLALLLVVLLAGAEWMFLLGTRLPAYTGPVAEKKSFPDFATVRANGTPFTQGDLSGDKNSVLVFFRGRW